MRDYREYIIHLTPVQNLVFSLAVIIGYIVIGWLLGFPEPACIINHGDVGEMITIVGILLFLSNMVRIFLDVRTTALLLLSSLVLLIFGIAMSMAGFFWAVFTLGLFIIVMNSAIQSPILLLIGMSMIISGYAMRNLSEPTHRPPEDYSVTLAKDNEIRWTMPISRRNSSGGISQHEILEYTGTKDEAIAFAYQRMQEIGNERGETWEFDPERHMSIRHISYGKLIDKGDIIYYRIQKDMEKYYVSDND